jgi:hypothetical protein
MGEFMGKLLGLSFRTKKILAWFSALAIVVLGAFVATISTPGSSSAVSFNVARDNTSNSIIYSNGVGGAMTTSELYSKYSQSTAAQHVFSAYHISASDVKNLGSIAVSGYATKDGNVYTSDGKLVATNAYSAGFHPQSHSAKHTYLGTTYYNTANKYVFLSNTIHGWVVMKFGVFQYMILASCGNPLRATPTTTPNQSLTCDFLQAKAINDNKYSFTFRATPKNGATVNHFVLSTGDGHSYAIATNDTTAQVTKAMTHIYAKAGSYNAEVAVVGSANGVSKTLSGAQCRTTINIPPAPIPITPQKPQQPQPQPKPSSLICSSLTSSHVSGTTYDFTVNATANNATISSYSINFGDGSSFTGTSNTQSHTYAKLSAQKDYQVTASVTGTVNGETVTSSGSCNTMISISSTTVTPPKPPKQIVKVQPQPTRLVETGPGSTLGIFVATSIVGTVLAKLFLKRRYDS